MKGKIVGLILVSFLITVSWIPSINSTSVNQTQAERQAKLQIKYFDKGMLTNEKQISINSNDAKEIYIILTDLEIALETENYSNIILCLQKLKKFDIFTEQVNRFQNGLNELSQEISVLDDDFFVNFFGFTLVLSRTSSNTYLSDLVLGAIFRPLIELFYHVTGAPLLTLLYLFFYYLIRLCIIKIYSFMILVDWSQGHLLSVGVNGVYHSSPYAAILMGFTGLCIDIDLFPYESINSEFTFVLGGNVGMLCFI